MSDGPPSGIQPPWPKQNGIFKTYDLHCHCGTVKYKITVSPPLYEEHAEGKEQYVTTQCNCSHCERHGAIVCHPMTKDIEWTQGKNEMREYRSASKMNPHYLCKTCGCFIGTDLSWLLENKYHSDSSRWTINCLMLKDFDRFKLKVKEATQMKHMPPKYEV